MLLAATTPIAAPGIACALPVEMLAPKHLDTGLAPRTGHELHLSPALTFLLA